MNRVRLLFITLVAFTPFVASAPCLGEDGARPASDGRGARILRRAEVFEDPA